MGRKQRIDWDSARTKYVRGEIEDLADVARVFGVHPSTVSNKSSEEGWVEMRRQRGRSLVLRMINSYTGGDVKKLVGLLESGVGAGASLVNNGVKAVNNAAQRCPRCRGLGYLKLGMKKGQQQTKKCDECGGRGIVEGLAPELGIGAVGVGKDMLAAPLRLAVEAAKHEEGEAGSSPVMINAPSASQVTIQQVISYRREHPLPPPRRTSRKEG